MATRPLMSRPPNLMPKAPMETHNPIVRAFQLAETSTSIDEIRKTLRQEGYSNVDAHLAGASIKADLKKRLAKPEV